MRRRAAQRREMKRAADGCGKRRSEFPQTRRQPYTLDNILEQRTIRRFFRLPRREFTRRQRYRDADGTVYAPALENDPLYRRLAGHSLVDPIDTEDAERAAREPCDAYGLPVPTKRRAIDQSGTEGTFYGSAVFFAEMKPDGRVHKWPSGDLEFVDPSNGRLYTGKVERSVFRVRSKGGYVLLRDVVDWGRLANPADFNKRARVDN